MTTRKGKEKIDPQGQRTWIKQIHDLQPVINEKEFRVVKRDKKGEPSIQKPFKQVTTHWFPCTDHDIPTQLIVSDFDSEDRKANYANSETVETYLKEHDIPYHKSDHGGRSPHLYIFFKLPEKTSMEATHAIRERLVRKILKECKTDIEKSGFDMMNITASRHLIRAFTKDFPERIKLWEVSGDELKKIVHKTIERKAKQDTIPRVFDVINVDILDPFFFVERSYRNDGALEFVQGKYYALAQVHELKTKIIIQSDRSISFRRGRICLRRLTSEEADRVNILEADLKKFRNFGVDNPSVWLMKEHIAGDPGVYFTERCRLNSAYIRKLKRMSLKDFNRLIDDYLFMEWKYDPRTRKWAESAIIRVSDNVEDHYKMKYRGHALIIKNSSSGFTTLAEGVGKCYGHNTEASLRGFSDGKTDKNSLLNNEFGSVVIDEFLNQEATAQGALNYMQIGRGVTTSGAVELEYKGLAKLAWIGNYDRDADTVEAMTIALERGMEKLSASSVVGLGARFGFVLFDDQVKPAVRNLKKKISREQKKENTAVVEDIIKQVIPEVRAVYDDPNIEDWLEEPDKEYMTHVRSLAGQIIQIGNNKIKTFVENNENATRHIKGCALEVSLKKHLRALFLRDYNIETILETAKEEYKEIKAMNVNSFIKSIGWYSAIDVSTLTIQRFLQLPSEATKAVVIALHIASKKVTDGQVLSEFELRSCFEEVPEEQRKEILGNYSHWSYTSQKIPRKYIQGFESSLRFSFCVEIEKNQDEELSFRLLEVDLLRRLDIERIIEIKKSGKSGKEGKLGKTGKTGKGELPSLPSLPITKFPESGGGSARIIENIISELCNGNHEGLAGLIDIQLQAQPKKIERDETNKVLEELKTKGIVFEPKHKQFKLTHGD